MARKRMIDPEFWTDEEIGQWPHVARLFYIGLWNFADDEARFKAHSDLLKSQIFPYDKRVNINKLKSAVSTKIQWYQIKGAQYGYIRNFLKYQKIDRPTSSKLPPPPPLNDSSASTQEQVAPNIKEVNIREVNISPNSEEFRLAKLLFSLIRERKPNYQVKIKSEKQKEALYQKWAEHIDKLIRIDERGPAQIEAVIRWCQTDDFWKDNILSTEKLREQIDKLELKMAKPEAKYPKFL